MKKGRSGMRCMVKKLTALCAVLCLGVTLNVHAGDNPEDPWEGFNRGVWKFNKGADTYFLKPIAKGYDWITPDIVDDGVSNIFSNLFETRTFLNDVLQFKFADAGVDVARFVVNSTVGLLGFFDVATKWGLERNQEDFGQTLATWGVGTGPYVVLPFWGPSNVRDGIALVPDAYSVPQAYIDHDKTQYSVYALYFVDLRADLLDVEELVQGDEYSFVRDVYLQLREFQATDGDVEDDFTSEDFEDE